MLSEQEFIKLLHKNNNEGCTDEERSLIDQYILVNHTSFGNDHGSINNKLISSTFDKIIAGITTYEEKHKAKQHTLRSVVQIAAAFILVSSITLLIYNNKQPLYNYIYPLKYTNITAANGKNVTVDLPDGSVVILNQNSKIVYSNRFNDKQREVSLTGEAYFKVAKNQNKPFVVHTGNLSTKVLGTSFNVEAYPFSKRIAVELITGKVWLTIHAPKNDLNYKLTPNQTVTYNILTGQAEKKNISDAGSYTAWKDGKLKFSNTSLDEVIKRVQITYKCRITLADKKLQSQCIYGEFGIGEKSTDVISAICALIKAKYIIKSDGEITIVPINNNK